MLRQLALPPLQSADTPCIWRELEGLAVHSKSRALSQAVHPAGPSPDRQQGVIRRVGLPADVYTSIQVIQNSVYQDKLNNNRPVIVMWPPLKFNQKYIVINTMSPIDRYR